MRQWRFTHYSERFIWLGLRETVFPVCSTGISLSFVVSIFPNYYFALGMQRLKKVGYDCRILENQPYIGDCLYEIRILDPTGVAKELLFSGERRTELYPENECYINTMEAEGFHV